MFCTQLFIVVLAVAGAFSDSTPLFEKAHFQSDSYVGYISENVAPLSHTKPPKSSSIFVRFVDELKPSVRFETSESVCVGIDMSKFKNITNIRLESDDDSGTLFELDANSFICVRQEPGMCVCFIQIKLSDSYFATNRHKLNREAKSLYTFQLKFELSYGVSTTQIQVKLLDDNDLEPMFDPSDYEFVLAEADQLEAFAVIGQVHAKDPDLSRNALVRYFLSCEREDSAELNDTECNEYFGVDWHTGLIYLKHSVAFMSSRFSGGVKTFEFQVKSLDTGTRSGVARTILSTRRAYWSYLSTTGLESNRTRKMLEEVDTEVDLDDDSHAELGQSNHKTNDLVNYKLVKYAAELYEHLVGMESHQADRRQQHSIYGTSIEAAYVQVKLVPAVKTIPQLNAKFLKLNEFVVHKESVFKQIKFRLEKSLILPFGFIQVDSGFESSLKIKPISGIEFKIERVYLNSSNTFFLVYLQPSLNEMIQFKAIVNNNLDKSIRFAVNVESYTILMFDFSMRTDLVEMIAGQCRLELDSPVKDIHLTNPSALTVLAKISSTLTNVYTTNNPETNLCEVYLSYGKLWNNQGLFHVRYAEVNNQTMISVNSSTGLVRLEKIFYGKLNFLISAQLYFAQVPLMNAVDTQLLKVTALEQRPLLNNDTSIYAALSSHSNPDAPPVVAYFKKNAAFKKWFDTIELSLAGPHKHLNLPRVLSSLSWIYNENRVYFIVYCFGEDLVKFDKCPIALDSDGTLHFQSSSAQSPQVNLLIRAADSRQHLKYLNLMIVNSSSQLQFEHQNCSILIRLNEGSITTKANSNNRVFLTKMNLKQNDSLSKLQFSLLEVQDEPSSSVMLRNCFEIDPLGNIYFKCKLPPAGLRFNKSMTMLRIEKLVKVTATNSNHLEAFTYLRIQFELSMNSSWQPHQQLNILMFDCEKPHEAVNSNKHARETKLISTLLVNDYKQLLRRTKAAGSVLATDAVVHVANVTARNFEFVYLIEQNDKQFADTAKLAAGTHIYRVDLAYLFRKLQLDDQDDECPLYEFNLVANDHDLFRLNRFSGLIELAVDWQLPIAYLINSINVFKYRLVFTITKLIELGQHAHNLNNLEFQCDVYFKLEHDMSLNKDVLRRLLPAPMLAQSHLELSVENMNQHQDYMLMRQLNSFVVLNETLQRSQRLYNLTYLIGGANLPFYVDSNTGQLFFSNSNTKLVQPRYTLTMIVLFKFKHMLLHELHASISIYNNRTSDALVLGSNGKQKDSPTFSSLWSSGFLDFSMPISSVDFIANMQSKLIGFFPQMQVPGSFELASNRLKYKTAKKRPNRYFQETKNKLVSHLFIYD